LIGLGVLIVIYENLPILPAKIFGRHAHEADRYCLVGLCFIMEKFNKPMRIIA